MLRTYKYRLYPSKTQELVLFETLDLTREVYNAGLQERKEAYLKQKISISAYDQMKQLKGLKKFREDFKIVHSQVIQSTLVRLDKAYQNFFRRCKIKDAKPGFPRFKGKGQFKSFTYPDPKGGPKLVSGRSRLRLFGVGNVKIKLHRPMKGIVKQTLIRLCGDGKWYANFVCDNVPKNPLKPTGDFVGLDVGITHFATLSSGEQIKNIRPFEMVQKRLKAAQRLVSSKKKRSNRRCKAVKLLAKQHNKVYNIRRDFHHKTALDLVKRFDKIAVEDLNIKGLAKGILSKQVLDAGWAQFISILIDKAESAGRKIIKVDPRGTSQICSGCGNKVPKSLAVRTHSCECGLILDRDHNAAINVLNRLGHSRQGRDENCLVSEILRSPHLK